MFHNHEEGNGCRHDFLIERHRKIQAQRVNATAPDMEEKDTVFLISMVKIKNAIPDQKQR